MYELLQQNKFRFLLSIFIALILALSINFFYARTNCFLLPLTTLYVMQTSIGNAFYQGIKRLFFISIVVAIMAVAISSLSFFYLVMHDVIIGAIIGIVANMLIFPRRADIEFRAAILPLIQSYNHYFTNIIDLLIQKNTQDIGNVILENRLHNLPDWVYAVGFDSGLQKSYRYFLVKLEQISDVLFAMHHLARYEYDKQLIAKIREPLLQCSEYINQFFSALMTVLELKTLTEKMGNLEKEITELENQFNTIVPLSLELLDMKRDYVYLAEFVYYFKDLRRLLLRLGETLR